MTKHKSKSKSKKDKKSNKHHSKRDDTSFASLESEALVRYSSNDDGYDSSNEQQRLIAPHTNGVKRRNNQREVKEMRSIEKEQDELMFLHQGTASLMSRSKMENPEKGLEGKEKS